MASNEKKVRSIFDDYQTMPELEKDGAWVTTSKGYEFKIARIGGMNYEYNNFLVDKSKSYQAELAKMEKQGDKDKTMTPAEVSKMNEFGESLSNLLQEAFARYVVKGWRGIFDRDGKEIPFNVDNSIKLMHMKELYNELYPLAQDYSTYLIGNLEVAGKN